MLPIRRLASLSSVSVAVPRHGIFNKVAAASAVALVVLTGIATLGGNVEKQEAYAVTSAKGTPVVLSSLPSMELTLSNEDHTSADVVELAIKPTAEGQFGRTALDVNVSTNNTAGYTLTMQADGSELKQTLGGTDYKIGTLTSEIICSNATECSEFQKDKWGYKIGDDDNKYLPITKAVGTALEIGKSDNPSSSSKTTVYFGSKLTNATPPGSYTGVQLTFVATTKVTSYSIKYMGGNSGATGVDASSLPREQSAEMNADSDTVVELSKQKPTRTNYTFTKWCTKEPVTDPNTLNDSCPDGGREYEAGDNLTIGLTDSVNIFLYAMWSVTKPAIVFNFDTGISKVTVTGKFGEATNTTRDVTTTGNSLNLMAGQEYTISPTYKEGYSKADTGDIKITTGGGDLSGYNYTPNAGGATIALASKANTYRITTGTATGISSVLLNGQNCSSGCDLTFGQTYSLVATLDAGYKFSGWSKSGAGEIANSGQASTTFMVGAGTATLTPSATKNTYSITIIPGSGIASVQLDNNSACKTATTGCSYTLDEGSSHTLKATAASGYEFETWTKTSGEGTLSNATSDSAASFTVGAGVATLTATGKMSGMQGMASCDGVDKVTDSRDGQEYAVGTLADGKCWMLDNLRLGSKALNSGVTIDSSNTHMAEGTSFANFPTTSTNSSFNSYTAPQINTQSVDTTGGGYSGAKHGVYYNYCAASAGTICGSSNSDSASYDICPKGWRLPTKAEADTLVSSYSSAPLLYNALHAPFSGYFFSSSLSNQGSSGNGYFWTSTYASSTYMYHLYVSSSNKGASSYGRNYGDSIRCVLGS